MLYIPTITTIKIGETLLLNSLAYANKNCFPFTQACFSALCAWQARSELKKTFTDPYKKHCCHKIARLGYQTLKFTAFGYLALRTTENKCQALANLVIFTNFALIGTQQEKRTVIKKVKTKPLLPAPEYQRDRPHPKAGHRKSPPVFVSSSRQVDE